MESMMGPPPDERVLAKLESIHGKEWFTASELNYLLKLVRDDVEEGYRPKVSPRMPLGFN